MTTRTTKQKPTNQGQGQGQDKTPLSLAIGGSSEDELLNSSQESTNELNNTVVRASHSSTAKLNKNLGGSSAVPSSEKTEGVRFHRTVINIPTKKDYSKALFILEKIKRNAAAGVVHKKDGADKTWYEDIVKKFEAIQAEPKSEDSAKRIRSPNESLSQAPGAPKRKRTAKPEAVPKMQIKRPLSEVVRDHLHVAMVDDKAPKRLVSADLWTKVEARLSELVMEHVLDGGTLPCFDSSEVVRGYRVVRCEDQFSRDFLGQIVARISDEWDDSKLGIIPATEIPKRPRARISLPIMKLEAGKLLKCLAMHNPTIPMNDWQVIKKEEPQKCSQSFVLLIDEDSLEPLAKLENRLRFGIRHVKIKIYGQGSQMDDMDEASNLVANMSVEGEEASMDGILLKDDGGNPNDL